MRPAVKHAQVQRQHEKDEGVESDPQPRRAHLECAPSNHVVSLFVAAKKEKT